MLVRKRFGETSHDIKPDISCCASSIPRGVALISRFAAGAIDGHPAILLYAPGEQTITAGDMHLKLKIETDYPRSGSVDIKLMGGARGSFTMMLGVPAWCDRFEARAGDESFHGDAGKFLVIRRTWKDGDIVHIDMDLPIFTIPQGPRWFAIQRGLQVLAHDDSINGAALPEGWSGTQIYAVKGTQTPASPSRSPWSPSPKLYDSSGCGVAER